MFEDWSTNQPSNNAGGPGEDCTHIWSINNGFCGQTDSCSWNDAPCTTTVQNEVFEVFRPICKQEQTVWDHP